MIARRLVIAVTLAASWPAPARAQHGHDAGHSAPATKPAPAAAEAHGASAPAKAHAPKAAAKATPPKPKTGRANLETTLKAIVLEIEASQRTPPPAPAPPRVRLVWRLGLTWPAELDEPSARASKNRVSLFWH